MTASDESPRRRLADALDDYCVDKCRREPRIKRTEDDVRNIYNVKLPELWRAHDRMVGWIIAGASSSILCLLAFITSLIIPLLTKGIH